LKNYYSISKKHFNTMKKIILLLACIFCYALSYAQPSKAQVIKRLTHAGVTNVEVVKIEKIWDNGKYVWVAHATVTKAVAPEKVGGVKGVTLLIATSAYYDLGAKEPYQVLGSESNGEYGGINLALPSNDFLLSFAKDVAQENPKAFFLQAYSILGIESVMLGKTPAEWIHPLQLKFYVDAIYVDKLTNETFQKLQAPASIILKRETIDSPWRLHSASMDRNIARYIGDPINFSDAPQWNVKSIMDR
jgi:hypothetical protein